MGSNEHGTGRGAAATSSEMKSFGAARRRRQTPPVNGQFRLCATSATPLILHNLAAIFFQNKVKILRAAFIHETAELIEFLNSVI